MSPTLSVMQSPQAEPAAQAAPAAAAVRRPRPRATTKRRKLDGAHWQAGYRCHVLRDSKDQVLGRIHRRGIPTVYVWTTERARGNAPDLKTARACVLEVLRRGIWQPDLFEARVPKTRFSVRAAPAVRAPGDLLERAAVAGCTRILEGKGRKIECFQFSPLSLERFALELLKDNTGQTQVLAALLAEAADELKATVAAEDLLARIEMALAPFAPVRCAQPRLKKRRTIMPVIDAQAA
jgi:hypothetical protein